MRFKNAKVPVDAVDLTDAFYRITTETGIDDLTDSIHAVGLLHPPLLLKLESSYRVVSGFRRISALSSTGAIDFDARLLIESDDPLEIAKISITENALQRPLNIVEKAISLKLLSMHTNDVNDIARMATPLGIPCDPEALEKYLKIANASPSLREGIIQGYVSMPVALILSDVEDHTLNCFLELFKILQLSLNRQREFFTLITEISHRDGIEPAQLMVQSSFTDVLHDENLDRNLKTKQLLYRLKQMRFPELSKAEASFSRHANNLKMGRSIKLIPPHQFEGTGYRVQLTFKNLKEISKLTSHLNRMLKDPDFEKAIER